jgi:hypothetical protein
VDRRRAELELGQLVEQRDAGLAAAQLRRLPRVARDQPDGVALLDVVGAEAGHRPHGQLEGLAREAGAVGLGLVVDDEGDPVGDALLGLAQEVLAGAGDGGPHDAPRVVADDVVAHAVELEALRPRPADRRPEGRVLPHPGQRPVEDRVGRGVHDHVDRLGEQLLVAGQPERVGPLRVERTELVDPAQRRADRVGVHEALLPADRGDRDADRVREQRAQVLLHHEGPQPSGSGHGQLDLGDLPDPHAGRQRRALGGEPPLAPAGHRGGDDQQDPGVDEQEQRLTAEQPGQAEAAEAREQHDRASRGEPGQPLDERAEAGDLRRGGRARGTTW